jgi:hypothetical protein
MFAELPSYFWFTTSVLSIVAIYYTWGRKAPVGSLQVETLSQVEPSVA